MVISHDIRPKLESGKTLYISKKGGSWNASVAYFNRRLCLGCLFPEPLPKNPATFTKNTRLSFFLIFHMAGHMIYMFLLQVLVHMNVLVSICHFKKTDFYRLKCQSFTKLYIVKTMFQPFLTLAKHGPMAALSCHCCPGTTKEHQNAEDIYILSHNAIFKCLP